MSLSSLVPAFRMSSTWLPDWSTTNVLGVATVEPAGGAKLCWNRQPEKTAAPLTAMAAVVPSMCRVTVYVRGLLAPVRAVTVICSEPIWMLIGSVAPGSERVSVTVIDVAVAVMAAANVPTCTRLALQIRSQSSSAVGVELAAVLALPSSWKTFSSCTANALGITSTAIAIATKLVHKNSQRLRRLPVGPITFLAIDLHLSSPLGGGEPPHRSTR